jgi:hypothetical protein
MPGRDGDAIFRSAVSGEQQFCGTVAGADSATDRTSCCGRPGTDGISSRTAATAPGICAPCRGSRSASCRISATEQLMRCGLLPQQRRKVRTPTPAGCRGTGRCHRPMFRWRIQFQPTSARYLLGPWWRRPMAITTVIGQSAALSTGSGARSSPAPAPAICRQARRHAAYVGRWPAAGRWYPPRTPSFDRNPRRAA